jgi:hypothetical protein
MERFGALCRLAATRGLLLVTAGDAQWKSRPPDLRGQPAPKPSPPSATARRPAACSAVTRSSGLSIDRPRGRADRAPPEPADILRGLLDALGRLDEKLAGGVAMTAPARRSRR